MEGISVSTLCSEGGSHGTPLTYVSQVPLFLVVCLSCRRGFRSRTNFTFVFDGVFTEDGINVGKQTRPRWINHLKPSKVLWALESLDSLSCLCGQFWSEKASKGVVRRKRREMDLRLLTISRLISGVDGPQDSFQRVQILGLPVRVPRNTGPPLSRSSSPRATPGDLRKGG